MSWRAARSTQPRSTSSPGDRANAGLTLIAPRRPGVQCFLEHHGDEFLVLTDEDAPNFKLMAAPVAGPGATPTGARSSRSAKGILLTDVEPFTRHVVLYGAKTDSARSGSTISPRAAPLRSASRNLKRSTPLAVPTASPVARTGSSTRTKIRARLLLAGHARLGLRGRPGDRAAHLAQTEDGSRPPSEPLRHGAALRHRRGRTHRSPSPSSPCARRLAGCPPDHVPCASTATAATVSASTPAFSIYRLALIDRGVSFAIAHVRGGAELGRDWWEAGRRLAKKTCFSDFIACAEHLIAQGRTVPDRLAIHGGSIGGLLVAVAANERPDLFRAVVAEVPGVDIIGILLRSSIGPVNQDELGDPNDPVVYDYLLSYSAYQNARAQGYPAIFVTGALHDTRTPYWVPAKWVARLRDVKTDDNPLLLHMGLGSGHVSVTAFSGLARELALWYAFVLAALGLTGVQPDSASDAPAAPRAGKRGAAADPHPPPRPEKPPPQSGMTASPLGARALSRVGAAQAHRSKFH